MKLFKKILFSALALVCSFTAFASCGGNTENNGKEDDKNNDNKVGVVETSLMDIAKSVFENVGYEYNHIKEEFDGEVFEETTFTSDELAMLSVVEMNSEYFDFERTTGLTDKSVVKEAMEVGPMMGSQAISFVLVRVADINKTVDIAKEMDEKINRRKWVCVEADTSKVAACGDVVFFAMVEAEFGYDLNKMFSSFETACGQKLSYQK